MVYTIKNKYLKAQIASLGGELKSLVSNLTGLNHIWCGDSTVWGKTSPNLFPHIGVPKGGGYNCLDTWYKMSKHGFLRDNEMSVKEKKADSITFEFLGNEATKKMFDYDFSIQISYILKDCSLQTKFNVINNSDKTMYFSLGGHTAFSTENNLSSMNDYSLIFDKPFNMNARRINSAGFLCDDTEEFGESDTLHLDSKYFDRDVIIFEDIPSKSVELKSETTCLKFDFSDFSHLGIWSKGGCDRYVCIEPWTTLPDRYDYDNCIETKKGIQVLDKKSSKAYSYTITIKE